MYSRSAKAKIRKTFPEYWEAKAWRHEQLELADIGRLGRASRRTLAQVAPLWLDLARAGIITNRSGRSYKPSTLRTIEQDFRLRLIPALGARIMAGISRSDLQRLITRWLGEGLSPSKVRGIVNAARVLWRDFDLIADENSQPPSDPTHDLRLPASTGRRNRIASANEVHRLIGALVPADRALWATAMYAGLRANELRGLQVRDIDLVHCRINVQRSWDQYEGEIEPKSEKGTRPTIITSPLHDILAAHLAKTGRTGTDLAFGRTSTTPFTSNTIYAHARKAWATARHLEDEEGATDEVERIRPIGLQECRHTAVSQMLDAGIPIETVSKFVGHASITITVDRYHHLLPNGEAGAIALLDAYHRPHSRSTS